MTRLDAYRIKRLQRECDALLVRARKYARPHVQSQFQIGYVPPLQHMAPGSAKPRGRYWLILVCVLVTVACINATAPSEQVPATAIAGK